MTRKKKSSDGGGNWMDTYGDMVTLLLTFFILLFSMSSVNEEKWRMLLRAFQGNTDEVLQIVVVDQGEGTEIGMNSGKPTTDESAPLTDDMVPIDFSELYKYIKSYVDRHDMSSSVAVKKQGENSVYIRFEDNIFFAADSAFLQYESSGLLDFIGNCFKSVEEEILIIRINGHTADPQIPNYQVSDRSLSTDRANSVLMYFEDMKEIDPKKLMATGYGKNYPVADNDTPEGRRKNRRVEMMILSKNIKNSSPEDLFALLEDTINASIFEDSENSEGVVIPQVEETPGDFAFDPDGRLSAAATEEASVAQ